MTVLYILAAILLLLLAIACLRIRVALAYVEDIRVELRILCFSFRLYPRKKRVRIGRYSYKKYRKRLLAQRKKEREAAPKKQAPPPRKKRPLRQEIRFYLYLVRCMYQKFLRFFRMDIVDMQIAVATGDAAETAVLTGLVSQTVAYTLAFLRQHANLHGGYRANVSVAPDFLSDKSRVSCNIVFSMRVGEMLYLGIRFFYYFLVGRAKTAKANPNTEEKQWQRAN